MHNYSQILLRLGLGAVMLWFAISQLSDPEAWVGYLPSWTESMPLSQIGFVNLNGWFELIFGILLIIGFYTRIVASLLAIHLLGIVITIGFQETGVRDFGLTVAMTSIALYGTSSWSVDEYLEKKRNLTSH